MAYPTNVELVSQTWEILENEKNCGVLIHVVTNVASIMYDVIVGNNFLQDLKIIKKCKKM